MNAILGIYRNSINFLYSHFYILFTTVPIQTIYTFSIKSCNSYLNIFSILPPITAFYRLTIVSLQGHLYTKYIQITYNITYKGSLDFGIPGVSGQQKCFPYLDYFLMTKSLPRAWETLLLRVL